MPFCADYPDKSLILRAFLNKKAAAVGGPLSFLTLYFYFTKFR